MHWRQHNATYWYKWYVSLLLITIQDSGRNIQFESKHCEHQYYRTTKIGTDRIAQLKKRSTIHTSYTVIQVYKRGVHSALSVATVASNIIRLMDWQYQINITRSKKAKNNKSQSTVDNSPQCKKRRAHSALSGASVVHGPPAKKDHRCAHTCRLGIPPVQRSLCGLLWSGVAGIGAVILYSWKQSTICAWTKFQWTQKFITVNPG